VRLDWQRFDFAMNEYSWLDRRKLEGLGFDYARAMRDPLHPPLPRPAFVALEYDGPAWQKWLNSAQQAGLGVTHYELPSRLELLSRLIPIDAAKSPETLLRKYPDRGKYLIVRGLVQLSATTRQGQLQLLPSISQLLPDTIHVPAPLSDGLANLPIVPNASPRYTLTLSYGRHFEPWLVTSASSQ
jgi:hypothetical protein